MYMYIISKEYSSTMHELGGVACTILYGHPFSNKANICKHVSLPKQEFNSKLHEF